MCHTPMTLKVNHWKVYINAPQYKSGRQTAWWLIDNLCLSYTTWPVKRNPVQSVPDMGAHPHHSRWLRENYNCQVFLAELVKRCFPCQSCDLSCNTTLEEKRHNRKWPDCIEVCYLLVMVPRGSWGFWWPAETFPCHGPGQASRFTLLLLCFLCCRSFFSTLSGCDDPLCTSPASFYSLLLLLLLLLLNASASSLSSYQVCSTYAGLMYLFP